ncbi:MAG: chitobiase/beta-hexosaminidase C-terminal domain-containing protein, partial [Pseudomonadota bacterium]
FASILTAKELPKLENAGWAYRLPAPGVIRVRDRIKTVSPLPGLLIECNNGNSWVSVYDCSTQEGGTIHFRTTNPSRNRAGRTVELTAAQQ